MRWDACASRKWALHRSHFIGLQNYCTSCQSINQLSITVTMSDIHSMIIEPLTKFYKDSSYLVKKCTKPDHKGKYEIPQIALYSICKYFIELIATFSMNSYDVLYVQSLRVLHAQRASDFWLWVLLASSSRLCTFPSTISLWEVCKVHDHTCIEW